MAEEKVGFELLIRSREGVIYQGKVYSLSSVNKKGKFDILPNHANFITLISSILQIGELDGKTKEVKIENGLLRVKDGRVEVYLGVAGLSPLENKAQLANA